MSRINETAGERVGLSSEKDNWRDFLNIATCYSASAAFSRQNINLYSWIS